MKLSVNIIGFGIRWCLSTIFAKQNLNGEIFVYNPRNMGLDLANQPDFERREVDKWFPLVFERFIEKLYYQSDVRPIDGYFAFCALTRFSLFSLCLDAIINVTLKKNNLCDVTCEEGLIEKITKQTKMKKWIVGTDSK